MIVSRKRRVLVGAIMGALVIGTLIAILAVVLEGNSEIYGLKAGGLDAGAVETLEGPASRGSPQEFGPIIENTWSSPAIIESVTPVSLSKWFKVTRARIWIVKIPKLKKGQFFSYLPLADEGWPPKTAPQVAKLPDRDVIIPPHGIAQLPFGATSLAPIGNVVRINGIRVIFEQKNTQYDWTFPINIIIHTCGEKKTRKSCRWSEMPA